MTTILQEAQDIIYGDREQTYGRPDKNLNAIAGLWTEYLQAKGDPVCVSAQDVCMMMVLMKVARQANAFKRDNLVDICGYAALNDRLENPQELKQCSSPPEKKKHKPSASSRKTVHTTV